MDDWWEDEDGCNGDTCAQNLTGYQDEEFVHSEKIYSIRCQQCQLRHRCPVGVMVLRNLLIDTMIGQEEAPDILGLEAP
jgi:hypothetical protein